MREELIDAYIGSNAETIKKETFNPIAGLLGLTGLSLIWFLYRKSYLIGFALIIFHISTSFAFIHIDGVIMFFVANKLYLWDAKRKIRSVLSDSISEDELINVIKTKGGTSKINLLVCIAVIIIFFIIFFRNPRFWF